MILENIEVPDCRHVLQSVDGTLDVHFVNLVEPFREFFIQLLQRRNHWLYVGHRFRCDNILDHFHNTHDSTGGLLLVIQNERSATTLCITCVLLRTFRFLC